MCLDLGKAATHALMEFWGDCGSHCFADELTAFTMIVYNVSFWVGWLSSKDKEAVLIYYKAANTICLDKICGSVFRNYPVAFQYMP